MPKYRIIESYDVQVTYIIEAKNEEKARDNITKEHAVNNNWEYRDLIEIEKL
tara:strand:+ start:628 stop:783 length:156 start_codon:yes stop_codon:yes gene_type:complete